MARLFVQACNDTEGELPTLQWYSKDTHLMLLSEAKIPSLDLATPSAIPR